MPAPQLTIDETSVGPRPILSLLLNKIGMVGHFNWGPVNVATLVQSAAQFQQTFGPNYESGLTGRISGDQVFAQNALAGLWVVRIAPSGTAAVKATKTFSAKTRVDAKYPGTEGSNVSVALSAGTSIGIKYTVSNASLGITEVWDNEDQTTVAGANYAQKGHINEPNAGSQLVTLVALADGNPATAAASFLSTGTAGTNGAPAVADYIGAVSGSGALSGFYALNGVYDVRWIFAAQQSDATVATGLQTYVASRTVADGLVMGLVNTPAAQAPSSVSFGTLDSKRLMQVWPWWQAASVPLLEQNNYVAIDGSVAGTLSTLNPWQSPSNKQVLGLLQPQYAPNQPQVDTVFDAARTNAVTLTRNRGVRIRAGITLSSDSAWKQVAIRGEYDRIEEEAWDATAWVVSENNTPLLRQQVADQCDALLQQELNAGAIAAFLPSICDSTNNTPLDISNGKLRCDLRFMPSYPADYVTLGLQRTLIAA